MSAYPADRDHLPALLDAARAGDRDAFGRIYDRFHKPVFRMLLVATRSQAVAEDLTSETFFRALRQLARSTVTVDYLEPWLMRIARNLAVDHFKSGHSRYQVTIEGLDTVEPVIEGPEDGVVATLTYQALWDAVDQLPANQRRCVLARFVHELTLVETAELMDCSTGAVKQLQHRGVRNLAALVPALVPLQVG